MAERPGVAQQAEILARQGRVDAAVAACYDALAIDHGQPHIRALLAHLMLEGDFYDEASPRPPPRSSGSQLLAGVPRARFGV